MWPMIRRGSLSSPRRSGRPGPRRPALADREPAGGTRSRPNRKRRRDHADPDSRTSGTGRSCVATRSGSEWARRRPGSGDYHRRPEWATSSSSWRSRICATGGSAIEVAHHNGEPTPTSWEKGPIPFVRSGTERTWLSSDLHFSDRAALEGLGRPFRDVGRMNEHLVSRSGSGACGPATPSSAPATSAIRTLGVTVTWSSTSGAARKPVPRTPESRPGPGRAARGGAIDDAVHAGAVRHRPAPGAEPRTAVGGPARHNQRARATSMAATSRRQRTSTSPSSACSTLGGHPNPAISGRLKSGHFR